MFYVRDSGDNIQANKGVSLAMGEVMVSGNAPHFIIPL